MNQLTPLAPPALPTLVSAAGERVRVRFLEILAANIRNAHARRGASGTLWLIVYQMTAIRSVRGKSVPLNSSGRPCVLARA